MDSGEIICNCMQITLEEIIEAINSGATSLDLLQETIEVGTGCGRCLPQIKKVLADKVG